MLAVGAMALLAIIVLRVNNSFLTTNGIMMESKFGVLATSLAQSVIEEATNKAYDEQSIGNPITSAADFTPVSDLGEDDEDYAEYDDFDDYNGYQRDIDNLPSAKYHIYCTVSYLNPANPGVPSVNQQWSKKITVYVTSESSPDTVKLSSVFSYWFF